VLLFTFFLSAAVAVAFSFLPLRNALRISVGAALKTSASTAFSDKSSNGSRRIVLGLQVALCFVLLTGAALLVRSMQNLKHVDLGFRTDRLIVFGINPQQRAKTDAEAVRFYEDLLNRIRQVPGVASATLTGNRIGSGWSNNTTAFVDGRRAQTGDASLRWNNVGPQYFSTLGLPVRYGRDFTEADTLSSQKVVVINETFANRYLTHQNPIGHHVALSDTKDTPLFTVVGVAGDSKYTGVQEQQQPMAYFPYKQMSGIGTMHVEVRTQSTSEAMMPALRRVLREFAPDLPLLDPKTQQAQFETTYQGPRLFANLSTSFGLLAVILVATGIYGTLSYNVSRRTAELGVRMALGASRTEVLWMVLRESFTLCFVGLIIGIPAAIACSRLMRSMLFGITPGDPIATIAALLLLFAVTSLASFIPAQRAASISPVRALRYE
jgi:predicted permease